jgi:hypothetical protein
LGRRSGAGTLDGVPSFAQSGTDPPARGRVGVGATSSPRQTSIVAVPTQPWVSTP